MPPAYICQHSMPPSLYVSIMYIFLFICQYSIGAYASFLICRHRVCLRLYLSVWCNYPSASVTTVYASFVICQHSVCFRDYLSQRLCQHSLCLLLHMSVQFMSPSLSVSIVYASIVICQDGVFLLVIYQ